MVTIYVVYADIFYLINVFMNLCILMIATKINRCMRKQLILRCLAASMVGSIVETIIFFAVQNEILYLLLSHFAVIPLMTFIVFGWNSFKLFFQNGLTCYGVALVLGGLTEAVENTFQIHNLQFFIGVFIVLISDKLLHMFYLDTKRKRRYLEVELKNREKKEKAMALLDSGNLLIGPDGKAGVHFIDAKVWEALNIEEDQFVGEVNYRTINTEHNVARVYVIDELTIFMKSFQHKLKEPYIAKAERKLFANKRYNVILNSQMEEEMEQYENKCI